MEFNFGANPTGELFIFQKVGIIVQIPPVSILANPNHLKCFILDSKYN